jgi:hypothetical protein
MGAYEDLSWLASSTFCQSFFVLSIVLFTFTTTLRERHLGHAHSTYIKHT